jgi:hypothetical protein
MLLQWRGMRVFGKLLILLALAVSLPSAAASSLVTSTSCMADGVASDGPLSCSVVSPQGGVAEASILSASGLFSGTSFVASQSMYAVGGQSFSDPGNPAGGPASATASADYWIVLDTAGLERPGFLGLTASVDADAGYSGVAGATLQIGSNSFAFTASKLSSCCSLVLPVTLGQPFLLDLSSYNLQNPSTAEGVSGGTAVSTVSLQFWEADASTAVPVFQSTIPEPASFVLALIGAVALFLRNAAPASRRAH